MIPYKALMCFGLSAISAYYVTEAKKKAIIAHTNGGRIQGEAAVDTLRMHLNTLHKELETFPHIPPVNKNVIKQIQNKFDKTDIENIITHISVQGSAELVNHIKQGYDFIEESLGNSKVYNRLIDEIPYKQTLLDTIPHIELETHIHTITAASTCAFSFGMFGLSIMTSPHNGVIFSIPALAAAKFILPKYLEELYQTDSPIQTPHDKAHESNPADSTDHDDSAQVEVSGLAEDQYLLY